MHIDPGELREDLQLYSRGTRVKDGFGHESFAWPLLDTVRGKYVPARADERFAAAQMQSDIVVRFFIRLRTDLDDTCRLTWNGVGYDIVAATPLPGRQWMELLCRKGVKDGR